MGVKVAGTSFVQKSFVIPTCLTVVAKDGDTGESPTATLPAHVAGHSKRLAVRARDLVAATLRVGVQGLDFPATLAYRIQRSNSAGLQRVDADHLLRVRLKCTFSLGSRGCPQPFKDIKVVLSTVPRSDCAVELSLAGGLFDCFDSPDPAAGF